VSLGIGFLFVFVVCVSPLNRSRSRPFGAFSFPSATLSAVPLIVQSADQFPDFGVRHLVFVLPVQIDDFPANLVCATIIVFSGIVAVFPVITVRPVL
jgi:hypothetical protein